jgi:hypothetical protein
MNTRSIQGFRVVQAPERKTLRPLSVVLLVRVCEDLCACELGELVFYHARSPFHRLKGSAYIERGSDR